jgi:Peptidase family S41/N-terminal domain of Peptidase_S41 in eukaryotic IRBP
MSMTTPTARPIGLLLAICFAILVQPALGAPRAVVDQIATIIENNYFDADKAREIATSLRADAQAGRFDALTDPRDLAARLTGRLQPLDHHFLVTCSQEQDRAASTRPASDGGAGPVMSQETFERRNAYGFRRVEMLPGAIGYIDMRGFADFSFAKPNEPARTAADAALALVSSADAIIIDVRNNAGGSPTMVGYLVSAFTAPEADIYNVFRRRDGNDSERPKASYPNPRLDVPLYVLISGRTASAAESAAYTLQAAKRAVIVGEVSGGASNPGGEFPIDAGFHIFVSTATTINPLTGTNWEDVGVKPDVAVAPEYALERAEILALEAVLAKNTHGTENVETRWTLEALRAERSPPSGPSLSDYVGAYAGATISAENGHLALRRGRRPPWPLIRYRDDVFFVKHEPYRRVLFERDASRHVSRFQLVRAGGPSTWFPRTYH